MRYSHHIVHILLRILIHRIRSRYLKPIPWPKPLKIIVPRQIWINILLHPQRTRRLIRPSPRRVLNRIAAPADENERNVLRADELDAVRVTEMGHVEWAEFVACERVGATLEDDGFWAETVKYSVDHLHNVVKQGDQSIQPRLACTDVLGKKYGRT